MVDCSDAVKQNASAELVPKAVVDSIIKSFPNDAIAILKELRFAGDHYSFNFASMYVGVEFDGHIHT